MVCFIVGGGACDENLIKKTILAVLPEERFVIAADRGFAYLKKLDIKPNYIIGDFDSAPDGYYEEALKSGCPVKKLNPVKDDTDSEAALNLAIELTDSKTDIVFMCGTGTRLDHVLGNIALLGQAKKKGRNLILLDRTNRISMTAPDEDFHIKKQDQYGKYISVMPYMGPVLGLTMKGFKYSLNNHDFFGFSTLTVSNEILENECTISHKEGYLIILETLD